MSEESKPVDPNADQAAQTLANMPDAKPPTVESDEDSEHEEPTPGVGSAGPSEVAKKKKKKSKRKKLKEALTGKTDADSQQAVAGNAEADFKKAIRNLTPEQISELVQLNPALAQELASEATARSGGASGGAGNPDAPVEGLQRLNLEEIMTGLASSGKNVKDMASYKFWNTQPVMKFGDNQDKLVEEGPLRAQNVEDVPTEPEPWGVGGFEWVTMDLTQESQLKEVYELLNGHYVEDDEAMFRFRYSTSILQWALMPPGWKKQWHLGIRSSSGKKKLCAFISAVPVQMRIRDKVVKGSEVNFMVIHKKLRNKRLAPVLIKEITRRCNLEGVWQAIHTAGIVLPKPVSTCRYYHRALNWQKLYEVGFSPLPPNSKPAYQIRKYTVPEHTSTRFLREMQLKDVSAVQKLLTAYLRKFELAPEFSEGDIEHWLVNKNGKKGEQVIWSYVVEDPDKGITDFFSFYCLESSVINNPKHQVVRAAYMFYYATETGLSVPQNISATKTRLNALIADALVLAKRYQFDVFNALSLMHNGLFLEQQKFGPGDGQLHYYIFNYRMNPIAGGVDKKNRLDEEHLSGVGFVML